MKGLLTRRNIIIGGVLAVLVVVLLIVLLTPQQQPGTGNQNNQSGTSQVTPISQISPEQKNLVYKDFLKSGKSQICTFSVQANNQTSAGTVYAANGKIRADFSIPAASGTIQQHMLVDAYMAYLWTNASNNGVKFTVQDENPTKITPNTNLNCTSWDPNLSVFEIPANIVFTEISAGNDISQTP